MPERMSQKDKLQTRKHYHSYHIPGQSHHHTIKKNAIFISRANSIKHELTKSLGAIMVAKFGDIFFNEEIIKALKRIEELILQQEPQENPSDFITEAVPNSEPKRRVDLVGLKNDDRFEFETDKKVKKDNAITVYI